MRLRLSTVSLCGARRGIIVVFGLPRWGYRPLFICCGRPPNHRRQHLNSNSFSDYGNRGTHDIPGDDQGGVLTILPTRRHTSLMYGTLRACGSGGPIVPPMAAPTLRTCTIYSSRWDARVRRASTAIRRWDSSWGECSVSNYLHQRYDAKARHRRKATPFRRKEEELTLLSSNGHMDFVSSGGFRPYMRNTATHMTVGEALNICGLPLHICG